MSVTAHVNEFVCVCVCVCLCLNACVSVCVSVCLSICLSICLSVCLCLCRKACVPVPMCAHPRALQQMNEPPVALHVLGGKRSGTQTHLKEHYSRNAAGCSVSSAERCDRGEDLPMLTRLPADWRERRSARCTSCIKVITAEKGANESAPRDKTGQYQTL